MSKNYASAVLREVKDAIRNPYAWPGGYPKYVVMCDGEAMSVSAARDNWRDICRDTLNQFRYNFAAAGIDINWEDPALLCCQTGKRIESAYADED